jgi:ATP-dependent DNA helicase 2 subunit 1
MELANQQYLELQDDEDMDKKAVQPEILGQTFPPCSEGKELNIAEVLVTCNFIFRDAYVPILTDSTFTEMVVDLV